MTTAAATFEERASEFAARLRLHGSLIEPLAAMLDAERVDVALAVARRAVDEALAASEGLDSGFAAALLAAREHVERAQEMREGEEGGGDGR